MHLSVTTFNSHDPVTVPIRGKLKIKIKPYDQQTPSFFVTTHIVPQITGPTPQMTISPNNWSYIQNLPLGDPSYHLSGPIDLLLGAYILPFIFLSGIRSGHLMNQPCLTLILVGFL